MAIYHLSAQMISRSQGRSAVASAAYRSGEKMYDERYEKEHDYTKKQGIAYSEILLPTGAPEWMANREKLWNAVEACERRKDAQLSREIQLSLPRELNIEQNILLAKEFVQREFVDKGMIADLNIHLEKSMDGEEQPHVHVMLTLREVAREGFGQKVRDWNRSDQLIEWREAWANTANRHLALHGFDLRIDHRSYAEQGIDLEPQHKIGAVVAYERLARAEDHKRIAKENGERILKDPQIALDAITRQQSTFTHQDLARFINRHSLDAEQFQQIFDVVKSHKAVVFLGYDAQGKERYTTHDMLALESRLMEQATKMDVRLAHRVTTSLQEKILAQCKLAPQQEDVFSHLTEATSLSCVVGYAGTGKSYLLGAACQAWESQGYRVLGATLSGIAAENLMGSSGIESRTLASRFYQWDRGRELLTRNDVLVIDEAGMVGSHQMAKVFEQAYNSGAKIVLVGDPEQLQAIDAGASFRGIAERVGYVELTEIRRQREAWQQEATRELATGKVDAAIARYQSQDHVHEFATEGDAKQAMVSQWNDVRINEIDKTQLMLAYTRADVAKLNEMARALRHELGELGNDHIIQTERGKRIFAEHDRIYFLKNERGLGVMNGSLGTIEKINGKHLTVRLDAQGLNQAARIVEVDTNFYNYLDHGYAATIHKAQGVTVDRSFVLASSYLDKHAAYVALSRHRDSAELFWSRETFTSDRDLVQALSRAHRKDMSVDYIETSAAFAARYQIEKPAMTEQQPFASPDSTRDNFIKHLQAIRAGEEPNKPMRGTKDIGIKKADKDIDRDL